MKKFLIISCLLIVCRVQAGLCFTEADHAVAALDGRILGIAVSGSSVYVCGQFTNLLKRFDMQSGRWSDLNSDYLRSPHGLKIYGEELWITDTKNHHVFVTDRSGNMLRSFGREIAAGVEGLNAPTDVAFADNGKIYIADGYGNSRMVCLAADGTFLFEWGSRGTAPGQFHSPHSIVIADNRIYVADRDNYRIQVFTMNGEFIEEWGQYGKVYGLACYNKILYIATILDDNDQIIVTDLFGNLIKSIGRSGKDAGQLDIPHAVAVDKNGLYIAEVGNCRIQFFAHESLQSD